jgi:hypothetical protein
MIVSCYLLNCAPSAPIFRKGSPRSESGRFIGEQLLLRWSLWDLREPHRSTTLSAGPGAINTRLVGRRAVRFTPKARRQFVANLLPFSQGAFWVSPDVCRFPCPVIRRR